MKAIDKYVKAREAMATNWERGVSRIRELCHAHGGEVRSMPDAEGHCAWFRVRDNGCLSFGHGKFHDDAPCHPDGDECARINQSFREYGAEAERCRREARTEVFHNLSEAERQVLGLDGDYS